MEPIARALTWIRLAFSRGNKNSFPPTTGGGGDAALAQHVHQSNARRYVRWPDSDLPEE